jgi:rare lipoprotein A
MKSFLLAAAISLVLVSSVEAKTMTASYYSVESLKAEGTMRYSRGFMANGRLFKDNGLTCASRDWPLGTRVRVTNLKTGKSVDVVVTDRINSRFKGKRIDLSIGAFKRIANTNDGLCRVDVNIIR